MTSLVHDNRQDALDQILPSHITQKKKKTQGIFVNLFLVNHKNKIKGKRKNLFSSVKNLF